MKTTREMSTHQEKSIVRAIGGTRTPNSGATKFYKGDIINGEWLIEAKTCMTPKKSFSIKQDWLKKMKEEQYGTNKLYSALCFDFGENTERFYVIDETTFSYLMELANNDNQ